MGEKLLIDEKHSFKLKAKFAVVALLLLTVLFVAPVHSQVSASIRYISVERITREIVYVHGPDGYYPVNATCFSFTFALFKVDFQADKCYYKTWVVRNGAPVLLCSWALGFSGTPPALQGVFPDHSTDLLSVHIITAEFPYTSEIRTNLIDGTQLYYFYRICFYFNNTAWKGEEVRVAADYDKEPTFQGSELLILKIKNEKTVDGETVIRFKEVSTKPKS